MRAIINSADEDNMVGSVDNWEFAKCQAVEGGKGDLYVSGLAIEYHYGRTIQK